MLNTMPVYIWRNQ